MKRGEIYYANLDPTIGSEVSKQRPVLIVSNNLHNQKAPMVTIVPLTSNVERVYPFEVFLSANDTLLPKDSKAMPQQIRAVSKQRMMGTAIAQLNAEVMALVEDAMKLHLGMD
ncbi:MAG: type II toxin-antitoxin system PemK/MazF family toxin [Acaryochloridaceae cyanobacterium RU_4_10]|nr:type II toxin-antitoxin system PemK/MazF family toxin [Acaryochloridaceae cyanobacterium RU_4_10]